MPEPDYTFDLLEIFLGSYPAMYYLEVVLRTGFMYVFTTLATRVIAKRSASQLTFVDMILVLVLGSAVGDTMFYTEIPLVVGCGIVVMIIGFETAIARIIMTSTRVHEMLVGTSRLVIENGKILDDQLKKGGFSSDDLCAKLRSQSVEYLEEVRRCYLEPSGEISVYTQNIKKSGSLTSILPENNR